MGIIIPNNLGIIIPNNLAIFSLRHQYISHLAMSWTFWQCLEQFSNVLKHLAMFIQILQYIPHWTYRYWYGFNIHISLLFFCQHSHHLFSFCYMLNIVTINFNSQINYVIHWTLYTQTCSVEIDKPALTMMLPPPNFLPSIWLHSLKTVLKHQH